MKENKRDKRVLIPRDEFEEEAGDGLGRLSREEAEADLRELKVRMERRLTRPRAIWLPAAAAVVTLLVASALLVSLLRERSGFDPEIALAEEVITDTALIAMAGPIEKESETPGAVEAAVATTKAKEAAYGPLFPVVKDEVAEAFAADEEVVSEVLEAQEEPDDVIFAVVQEEQAEEVIVQAIPQMAVAAKKIRAENRDKTTTEAAGKKEAATVDAVTEARKDAAAVEASAGAAAVPGAVMSDSPASPVVGWSDYRDYVARNMRYPDGIVPVVRHEVVVSFTVRTDSTLSDLKVVLSPGDAFTREAFRLLREGPLWIPARIGGNQATAEITVMFVFK